MIYRWIRCDLIDAVHLSSSQAKARRLMMRLQSTTARSASFKIWRVGCILGSMTNFDRIFGGALMDTSMINHEIKISSVSEGTISLMILKQWWCKTSPIEEWIREIERWKLLESKMQVERNASSDDWVTTCTMKCGAKAPSVKWRISIAMLSLHVFSF